MQKNDQTIRNNVLTYPYVRTDSNMAEIANTYAVAARIMTEYGLHCIGCFANTYDTVETGCMIHGMSEAEMHQMLTEINDAIESEK